MSSQSAEVGRVGSNKLVYFFGALGGLLFGYDTGVIAGAILFINKDLELSPFMSGLVVSSLLVGAMIGAAFAGPIADATGRRRLVLVAALIFARERSARRSRPTRSCWCFSGWCWDSRSGRLPSPYRSTWQR